MAWSITADPQRFDEAVEWMLARSVITAEEAKRLDADARQRAFWIGGGLQLSQIQRVFDEIAKAIESGEPFADFKKRMRFTLRDPVHSETVFRNATQRAYSAGRYQQMREVAKWRPYWMFSAILDDRRSPVCRKLSSPKPVILPADDPFWDTHIPPLHHRCRSGIRSLRREEALRRGVTKEIPELPSTEGWGRAPDSDPVWKPDPKKHEPGLVDELAKKQKKAPKPKAPAPNPKHDPAHWAKEYEHLGEAGQCAAYGRAMYERALDRKPSEISSELRRLRDAGHPSLKGVSDSYLTNLAKQKTLRDSLVGKDQRGLLALSEHTRTIKPGDPFELSGTSNDATNEARKFYALTLDKSVKRPQGWKVELTPGARAKAEDGIKRILLGTTDASDIAIHEMAHAVEFTDFRALKRSRAFLRARTSGEKLQKMEELAKRWKVKGGYGDDEVGRGDKFWHPYVGKEYRDKDDIQYATEVTSMGYQQMSAQKALKSLGDQDQEMLFFLLGQLAGK